MKEQNIDFEELLKKLDNCIENLKQPNIKLKDAIYYFKEGTELKQKCEKIIQDAKNKIKENEKKT